MLSNTNDYMKLGSAFSFLYFELLCLNVFDCVPFICRFMDGIFKELGSLGLCCIADVFSLWCIDWGFAGF